MDVDAILLAVYRARLEADSKGAADRMVADDKDDGTKQRNRAECYRAVVVETLVQAGVYSRPVRVPPNKKPRP